MCGKKDVDNAREALKKLERLKLEAQRLEQARTAFEQRLREAASVKSPERLLAAIKDAESDENSEARSLPQEDRIAAIRAARAELQIQMLQRLRDLSDAEDMDGLSKALKDAGEMGVAQPELDNFADRLRSLQLRHHHRNELRSALKRGEKSKLLTVVKEASEAGLNDDENLLKAKAALKEVEAREKEDAERAAAQKKAEDERQAASKQVRLALSTDDIDALTSALLVADAAGLGGVEVAPAQERLRVLRAKAGASRELDMAMASGDVYKLRAAISSVRGTAVDEKQLAHARAMLGMLTGKAGAHRALAAALASEDAEILTQAIQDAKEKGLSKADIAQAEAKLKSTKHTSVVGVLQAAMESDDIGRLRMAAGAAADAGMVGQQLSAAWERIRSLESQEWSLREIRTARASGASARLQVAISHAEQAGVSERELEPARAELRAWLSRSQAHQDLQLARASGSAHVLRTALGAARAAGVTGGMLSAAEAELRVLERGGAWRPPPPSSAPPAPPDDGSSDDECRFPEGDGIEPEAPIPRTDPHLHLMDSSHSAGITKAPKTVNWGPNSTLHCGVQMVPQAQPQVDRGLSEIDCDAPLTDPQVHSMPPPPPTW